MSIVNVIKRNGKREVYNCKKIKKAIAFACENLEVNPLQLEAKFDEFIKDGVTTASIQENLILHAKNLSSPTNDQWLLVAGRLATMGRWNDTRAYDVPFSVWYKKARTEGKWIHKQFEVYSDEDIEYFGTLIQKNRDLNHTIASVETAISKYLYPDECIQQMFMGEAMLYASVEPINTRRIKVLEWYTELSLLELSLATPHLMNLRQAKQVASCFPANSVVRTYSGNKNIQDVEIGDLVLTHQDRYRKVLATQVKEYNDKFVSLDTTATFLGEFTPTKDHLIYTIKRSNSDSIVHQYINSTPEWITSDSIRLGDYVKIPLNKAISTADFTYWGIVKNHELMQQYVLEDNQIILKNKNGETDGRVHVVPNLSINTNTFFRLLGYYIAEGCVCSPSDGSKHVIFTFGKHEEDFLQDLYSILQIQGFNYTSHVNDKDNSCKVTVYSKVLCSLFLVLIGTGFDQKRLSNILKEADYTLQEELLVGCVRGDGCAVISGYTLTLSNKTLIQELRDLALRCSFHINMNCDNKLRKGATTLAAMLTILVDRSSSFAIKVNKNIQNIREVKSKTGFNIIFRTDGVYARVRNISSYVKECLVYDLQVEEDSSFTVNSIASHNCFILACNDNLDSIYRNIHNAARISKNGGGIGFFWGLVRAKGSMLMGESKASGGVLPFIKVLNDTLVAVNQRWKKKRSRYLCSSCMA